MTTKLTEKFKIDLPIIQAPMAGVSTPALAAAVSNAGGLGSVALGALTIEAARQAIEETRALTRKPINVNIFCHEPPPSNPAVDTAWLAMLTPLFERFDAKPPTVLNEIYRSFNHNEPMLNLLLEFRPAVVSFHFGLPPENFIEALRRAGILLIASATSLREAALIERAGLDAVIAQGIEAGGHRGVFNPADDDGLGTLDLTRLLVRETKLPVIAAGGIMDGAGLTAALSLGAQAAQLGTAFIACPESSADADYRAALLGEQARHTILTSAISGRPARGFSNGLTAWVSSREKLPVPAYPLAYDAAKALHASAKATGSQEFATRWAGQGAPLSRAMPAAELMRQLQAEMDGCLET